MAALNGTQNEKVYISNELYEKLSAVSGKLAKGDVLVTGGGSVGNPYIVPNDEPLYTKDADLLWIKNNGSMDPMFVYEFFFSPVFREYLGSVSHVGTIAHYTISQLSETPIALPSIEEQRRIGVFLELIDKTITLHQRKHYGHQDSNSCGRFKPFLLHPTSTWEQRKLDELCSLVTKQTGFDYSTTIKPSLVTEHLEGTLPFIQNKDFSGNTINMDTDFYIPEEVVKKYPKITLDQPCLLISISGKIGNVGLYKRSERAFIGGAVGICRLMKDTNGEFIMQELLSEKGQKYFQSLIKASSHQNITVEDIRKIEISMPSALEQERISTMFDHVDNLITLHQRNYVQHFYNQIWFI